MFSVICRLEVRSPCYFCDSLMVLFLMQVNVNLAGLPALVLPCGFVEGESASLPVGCQMVGAAFDEVRHFSRCAKIIWYSKYLHPLSKKINK